ncbi:toxin-antitoxin system YwqK family antitoxin [Flavobacterium faecale]|nr:hypothetical protein [Flavobacterium faecale]
MKFQLKNSICCLFFFLITACYSQEKTAIYYDSDWKVCTKENYTYYRPMPLKEIGDLVFVRDYYKNGNLQMQGYFLKKEQEQKVGDIYWYDENGMDSNSSQYYNISQVPELTYYYPDGKLWKKVNYKNEVKEGATTIYKKDGSVLMSGKFHYKKPVSGNFNNLYRIEHYYGKSLLQEKADGEQTTAVMVYDESLPSKTAVQPQANIYEKLFWSGGQQLAQSKAFKLINDYDNPKLIGQKNYDKSGNSLQSILQQDIDYGYKIKNGNTYEYYTQNNFVVGVKSITPYVERAIQGKIVSFYPNGKMSSIVNYKKGKQDGEALVYNTAGNIENKQVWKNGKPYQGNFVEKFSSQIFIHATYSNGAQVGEVTTKTDKDSIITKGTIKEGKPYQGSFLIEDPEKDRNEIVQINNFIKTGKQIIFNYNFLKPIETHTLINGLRNGESVYYKDGEVVSRIICKNGKFFDGTYHDDEMMVTYENGFIIEETSYERNGMPNKKIVRSYKDNQIQSVSYSEQFILLDVPQQIYTGTYKNGLPFDGFFREDGNEIKTIEYYENGILKHQYSNDYLKNMEKYSFPEYDLKSTFKDGKVFDGMEYKKESKSYISKKWKNGVLQSIDFDVFAMHYFNRISFNFLKESIEITDYQSKGELIIEEKNKILTMRLIGKGQTLFSKTSNNSTIGDELPRNGGRAYILKNNKVVTADFTVDQTEKANIADSEENFEILTNIFYAMIYEDNTLIGFKEAIAQEFMTEYQFYRFVRHDDELQDKRVLATIQTNEKSQPSSGIQVRPTSANKYNLDLFYGGRLYTTLNNVPFEKLEIEVENLYKLLNKKLQEEYNR